MFIIIIIIIRFEYSDLSESLELITLFTKRGRRKGN